MNRVKKTTNNTKGKRSRKAVSLTAVLLILAFIFSFIPSYSGSAASNYLAIAGPKGEPLKREVIYGKLAADGSSENIYVVNHYDLSEMQSFTDYGDYSNVLQLTGEKVPQLDSGEVKLQATAGSYYYQGNLESTDLPWLIDISYELDGQKIPYAQVAGVTGELFIKIAISANPAVDPFFFDHYALQASATLRPDKARLLKTDDSATIAISGEDRMVSWIVLPGQEADLFLKLQVDDFEMESMTFAGIGLNFDFDFELDELSDETEGLDELSDGIKQLADGAQELEDAIGQLQEGFAEIESGSGSLAENGPQLSQGAGDLQSGSAQLGQGVAEYTGGVRSINNGMAGFSSGLKQLRCGVAQLADNGSSLSTGSGEILGGLQQILQGLPSDADLGEIAFDLPSEEELAALDELVAGSAAFKAGLDELAGGAASINIPEEQMAELMGQLQLMTSNAGNLPEPAFNMEIPGEQGWKLYLTNNGFTVPETENASAVLGELAKLSTMAAFYSSSYEIMNGALDILNDPQMGYITLLGGLQSLSNGISNLAASYTDIHNGLVLLVNQLKELAAMEGDLLELLAGLSDLETGLNTLAGEYEKFDAGLYEYTQGVSQLLPVFDGTADQAGLLAGANHLQAGLSELDAGSASLTGGLNEFSAGAAEYKKGVDSYIGGVSSFDDGLGEFRSEGLDEFADGFGTFTEGALEFKEETANLQDDFMEQLEEIIAEYTDMDFEPRSFVSEKNTNVASVQFVLMTEAISTPDDSNGPTFEPEIEGDFFSRLRALFVIADD